MTMTHFRLHAARGFTLVETIIVMVVTAIAAVTIAMMSGNLFNSQTENQDMQIGVKLIQECAEHVLAMRRATASLDTFTPSCTERPDLPGNLATRGFSKPTATPAAYSGPGCPTGMACKLVTVTVSMPGGNLNPVTLLLVP